MNRKLLLLLIVLVVIVILLGVIISTLIGLQPKNNNVVDGDIEIETSSNDSQTTSDSKNDLYYLDVAVSDGNSSACLQIKDEELRKKCLKTFELSGSEDTEQGSTTIGNTNDGSTDTGTQTNTRCETSQVEEPFELDGTKTPGIGMGSDKDINRCWTKFKELDNVYGTADGTNIWTLNDSVILGSVQEGANLADSNLLYNDANRNGKYDDSEDISKPMGEEDGTEENGQSGSVYGCCVVCSIINDQYGTTGHTFFVASSTIVTTGECDQINENWKDDPYGWYGDVFWSNDTYICPMSGNSISNIDVYKFCENFGRVPPY